MILSDIAGKMFGRWPAAVNTAVVLTAAGLAITGIHRQIAERRDQPAEAYGAAVSALRDRVAAGDLLLVHAGAQQGFRLESTMQGWHSPAIYGETGWPCCRRGVNPAPGSSTAEAVRNDLAAKIPAGFRGRVWLVYANRQAHWDYIGLDEGNLWRNTLWDRGCPPGPYLDFGNLVVSPMLCSR
jgi:hypothetical protein